MNSIFISYRREDTEGHAGRLFDELQTHFGKDKVFMDVSSIGLGHDFREVIDQSVATCTVQLAIIGSRWLDVQDASGRRRIDDAGDFVRLEIASALKRSIPVVPVLVQGAKMPYDVDLPEDLKGLAFRNGMALSHAHWESDVGLLIESLRKIVTGSPAAAPTAQPSLNGAGIAGPGGIAGEQRGETRASTVGHPVPGVLSGQTTVESRPASTVATGRRKPLIGLGIVLLVGGVAGWYWFGGTWPADARPLNPGPAPAPAPGTLPTQVPAAASVPVPVAVPAPAKTLTPEPVTALPAVPSRSYASEIRAVLTRMNSADKAVRMSATAQLMAQFSTSAEAIGLAVSALDDRQQMLRIEGRINVLTYLERSEPGAWTEADRSRAKAILARLRASSAELGLGNQALTLIRKLSNRLGP